MHYRLRVRVRLMQNSTFYRNLSWYVYIEEKTQKSKDLRAFNFRSITKDFRYVSALLEIVLRTLYSRAILEH